MGQGDRERQKERPREGIPIMGRDAHTRPDTVRYQGPLPQIGWWGDANLTCLDQGRSKGEEVMADEITLVPQMLSSLADVKARQPLVCSSLRGEKALSLLEAPVTMAGKRTAVLVQWRGGMIPPRTDNGP